MVLTRARGRLALTQTAARPFRILDLPPELVTQTFEHLASSDPCSILSARFTCRAIRDHSIVAFGKNFFGHLVAMLHPISLTVLLEIATHEQLSKFVQKVTISGERIGAIIKPRDVDKGAVLKDLQTGMENSGMDRLILIAALPNYANLTIIRIDNSSFYGLTESVDAAQCGRRHIIEKGRIWDVGDDQDQRVDRTFRVTLASIKDASLEKKVKMEVDVSIVNEPNYHVDYFDPKSPDWVEYFSGNITTIQLTKHATCPSALDLLRSTPNLEHLQLEFSDEAIEFRRSVTAGLFMWPRLSHFGLLDTSCHDTLAPFLELHKNTLTTVSLQAIELISGTWKDVFRVIESMPRIRWLDACNLNEQQPSQCCKAFDQLYDADADEAHILKLATKADISKAVGALLDDFRTFKMRPYFWAYTVDCRLANAIINGEAVFREGK